MNKTSRILSFRYKKNNIFNYFKRRKLELESHPIVTRHHDSCPVCNSKDTYLIAEVDRVGFPCDIVVCKKCQFVFNDSFIANPDDYYSYEWGAERWGEPEKNFQKRTAENAFSWRRMTFLLQKLEGQIKDVKSVLEIGCGDGCNLLPFHIMGKQVVGYDFDESFLIPGRDRGMELLKGDVCNIPTDRKFDLIMMIHSFEHVVELDKMIRQVATRLTNEGIVFIEVPGLLNWNRKRSMSIQSMGLSSNNNLLNYLQFQHNYHFDLEHIKILWERNGFELIHGDQWVRAIFRKKKADANNEFSREYMDRPKDYVLNYLATIEKDYLSPASQICRLLHHFITNKCNS